MAVWIDHVGNGGCSAAVYFVYGIFSVFIPGASRAGDDGGGTGIRVAYTGCHLL